MFGKKCHKNLFFLTKNRIFIVSRVGLVYSEEIVSKNDFWNLKCIQWFLSHQKGNLNNFCQYLLFNSLSKKINLLHFYEIKKNEKLE